jgi:hypothetical protein
MKKKKTTSEQFQDQIEKSLKGENSIPCNKQIHDWFGTCTSIKSGGFKLSLWAQSLIIKKQNDRLNEKNTISYNWGKMSYITKYSKQKKYRFVA